MPTSPYIQLVCFDIGGVMMRILRSWEQAIEAIGIKMPARDDLETITRRAGSHSVELDTGRMSSEDFARRLVGGIAVTPDTVMDAINAWLVVPYSGIDDLIETLGDTHVRTACLSNTMLTHWEIMNQPGHLQLPFHRMDHHFTSFTIGAAKPDPRIYEYVERTVGLPADSILFFDDHPPNVDAARRRGWHSVAIDPDNEPPAQMMRHLRSYGVLEYGGLTHLDSGSN